jgi:hypothetical protein
MAQEEERLASVVDPDGRQVVLLAGIWNDKIVLSHPDIAGHLDAVVATVAAPDHVEPDLLPKRTRYKRNAGPSHWRLVVVSFEQEPAHHHRGGQSQGSGAMEDVNIRIRPFVFEHASCDEDGDVHYLHIGPPQPGEGEETPEGHVLRFVPGTQRVVGLTVINARHVLDRDGRLVVTVPETVEASAEEFAAALQAA